MIVNYSISAIIPVYNEAANVPDSINKILSFFSKQEKYMILFMSYSLFSDFVS